jgi:hypothetical protein
MKVRAPLPAPKKPEITPDIKGFFTTSFLKYPETSPDAMFLAYPRTLTVSMK